MGEGGALPQSLEAERAVLGGLMLDPEQCLVIAETLKPDDFYREAHAKLFGLMVGMAEASKPTELVAVVEHINAANVAADVGGLAYVTGLSDNVPSTQNLEYFATIVERFSNNSKTCLESFLYSVERIMGQYWKHFVIALGIV